MDHGKITENIIRLREDVAEIKQKLNSDFADLHYLTTTIKDHEKRLTTLETAQNATSSSLRTTVGYIFQILTLAIAIVALVKGMR